MEHLASEFSLDLARSYAYGDSYTDRWMLERTGNPRVIRGRSFSSRRLARLAQQRGWPVLPWGRERSDEEKNDAETQRARRSAEKSEWRAA
jgi:phosphoserine phosphatase